MGRKIRQNETQDTNNNTDSSIPWRNDMEHRNGFNKTN